MAEAGEKHRFDKSFVGLTRIEKPYIARAIKKAKQGNRDLYYVKKEGLSNKGHYFEKYFDGLSHEDRLSIVEYLKTLN